VRLAGVQSNIAALRRAPGVDPAPRVEVRSKQPAGPGDPEASGAVEVTLSPEALSALERRAAQPANDGVVDGPVTGRKADDQAPPSVGPEREEELAIGELSESDQELVRKLVARDAEVRTHEQAHIAAGGQYINGGPTYSYQTGPDGKRYAIGGSVSIDTSPVAGDPEATLEKARVVERAALAPKDPSSTDRQVASAARKMAAAAQSELAEQRTQERASASAGDAATTGAGTPRDQGQAASTAPDSTDGAPAIGNGETPGTERVVSGEASASDRAPVARGSSGPRDPAAVADAFASAPVGRAAQTPSPGAIADDDEGPGEVADERSRPRLSPRRAARAYAIAGR